MLRTLAYRLYPTAGQAEVLERHLDACRRLYNAALEERHRAWRDRRVSITRLEQQAQLPIVRREMAEFRAVFSSSLQEVLRRLDVTFWRFKKGLTKYPRFRSRSKYRSLSYPQHGGGYKIGPRTITFSKIGVIRARCKLPSWVATSQPKSCCIKNEPTTWTAFVRFEVPDPAPTSTPRGAVGIDLGLRNFFTISNGQTAAAPRFYSKAERRLAKLQRKLRRRQAGGFNRAKALLSLQRVHARIKRQRLDFHHKLTNGLSEQFGFVAIETNLSGLSRSRLAKHAQDAGWGSFVQLLEYKVAARGGTVVKVPARFTTQTCSECGTRSRKSLADRFHHCPRCGLEVDRDLNAAKTILRLATVPEELGELTPAEIADWFRLGTINRRSRKYSDVQISTPPSLPD